MRSVPSGPRIAFGQHSMWNSGKCSASEVAFGRSPCIVMLTGYRNIGLDILREGNTFGSGSVICPGCS